MAFGNDDPTPERPIPCGRYELLERIGFGGMAEIFRARLPGPSGFAKTVVIKRILPRLARDELIARMFADEAKIAAAADHANIAQAFELGLTDDGQYFLVMEYIPGLDLEHLFAASKRVKQPLPPWLGAYVVAEVLEGLSYVHGLVDEAGRPRNVIHRDANPSNIFVSRLGQVKLSDFGVADYEGKSRTTQAGQLKGKIAYMSPEQLSNRALDARSDVFSMGVVLWECLTSERLFGNLNEVRAMLAICDGERRAPSSLRPEVPKILDAITLRALAADRDARYPSAEAFQADVLAALHQMRPPVRRSEVRAIVESLMTGAAAPQSKPQSLYTPDGSPEPATDALQRFDDLLSVATAPTRPGRAPLGASPARPVSFRPSVEDSLETVDESQDPSLSLEAREVRALISSHTGQASPIPDPAEWPHVPSDPTVPLTEPDVERAFEATGPYAGPHPFWVKRPGERPSPLDYRRAVRQLAEACQSGLPGVISADAVHWIEASELARLARVDLLLESEAPPSNVTVVGTLEQRSLAAVFGVLARDRATGTLAVANTAPGREDWYELHVLDGRPTKVVTNVFAMQYPDLSVSEGLVPPEAIDGLVHTVVLQRKALDRVIREAGLRALGHAEYMQIRLQEAFRWSSADYTFNVDFTPPRDQMPFAPSLLTLLPKIVARVRPQESLESALGHRLDVSLEPSDRFPAALEAMEPSPAERRVAMQLADGTPAVELILSNRRDKKLVLTLAYVLWETDLLLEKLAPKAPV